MNINQDILKESLEKLNKQKEKIGKIIQPFQSDNLTDKQSIELCHIGKFLSIIGASSIIKRAERPDFIISYKSETIGLEHERLFVSDKVRIEKSIQKLFDDSAKLFKSNHPEYKILANCWLTTNNFRFQKKDTERLKNEISEYIYAIVSGKANVKKPSYLDRIHYMKHSRVHFSYNSGAYCVQYLEPDILLQAIQKKERLVKHYIEKSNINKHWLLIVIGSVSPDSYEFGDYPFSIDIISDFDKIFLMEDFNSKVWQLKP